MWVIRGKIQQPSFDLFYLYAIDIDATFDS